MIGDAFVLRACFINPRTATADVDALVDEVEACGALLEASSGGAGS